MPIPSMPNTPEDPTRKPHGTFHIKREIRALATTEHQQMTHLPESDQSKRYSNAMWNENQQDQMVERGTDPGRSIMIQVVTTGNVRQNSMEMLEERNQNMPNSQSQEHSTTCPIKVCTTHPQQLFEWFTIPNKFSLIRIPSLDPPRQHIHQKAHHNSKCGLREYHERSMDYTSRLT
jgi:hypothetical protein